jgi:transcriptional regulator with XRE-family HTH domain
MAEKQSDNLMQVLEQNIRQRSKALGITLSDLCKHIEMTEAGFYKMLTTESIKVKTLRKIAEVLEMPVTAFLKNRNTQTGYPTPDDLMLAEPETEYNNEVDVLKKQIKQLKSQLRDKEKIISLMSKQ